MEEELTQDVVRYYKGLSNEDLFAEYSKYKDNPEILESDIQEYGGNLGIFIASEVNSRAYELKISPKDFLNSIKNNLENKDSQKVGGLEVALDKATIRKEFRKIINKKSLDWSAIKGFVNGYFPKNTTFKGFYEKFSESQNGQGKDISVNYYMFEDAFKEVFKYDSTVDMEKEFIKDVEDKINFVFGKDNVTFNGNKFIVTKKD